MTFFYYEIPTKKFIIATNLTAVSDFAGIPYHKMYGWFNNGSTGPMAYVEDNFICGRSDLVRGRQRLSKREEIAVKEPVVQEPTVQTDYPDLKGIQKEKVPRTVPDEFNDFFNSIGEKDN